MRRLTITILATTILVGLVGAGPATAHHRPGPCDGHWWKAWTERQDTRPIVALIRDCAATFGVSSTKALAIAWRESRYRPSAYNASGASGIFQHLSKFWPGRFATYARPRWHLFASPFNARTNIVVTMRMVRRYGWGPWGG